MQDAAAATRETRRVLAELVADHGRADVIHRRWECSPEVRDRLLQNLDRAGVLGGAGVVVERDGAHLLVRHGDGDGWSDPGVSRQPGEGFSECARRGVRVNTGLRADIGSLAQIHVLYADDWTDREPVAHPFVLYDGTATGDPEPRGEVTAVGWFTEPPQPLRYEELAELF